MEHVNAALRLLSVSPSVRLAVLWSRNRVFMGTPCVCVCVCVCGFWTLPYCVWLLFVEGVDYAFDMQMNRFYSRTRTRFPARPPDRSDLERPVLWLVANKWR